MLPWQPCVCRSERAADRSNQCVWLRLAHTGPTPAPADADVAAPAVSPAKAALAAAQARLEQATADLEIAQAAAPDGFTF